MLPSAASLPATAAPLALLVTVTFVAVPCATCTTIGVVGFSPCVAGVIDTTGRGGGAGASAPQSPSRRDHGVAGSVRGGDGQPAAEDRSTSTPSAAGSLCRLRSGAIGAVTLHPIG